MTMSMLSSMTEKMRETADKVERFERRNSDWLWRDATTITRAAVELRDAADTIDYLRNTCNDLQVENEKLKAENAKLKEQIHWLKRGDILHVLTDQEYIDQCERERLMQVSIDALDKDNEKLRELVRDMWRAIPKTESCGWDSSANTCTGSDECRGECALWHRMRALGVEVDDA